jgi:hypothetical protein
MNFRNIFLSIFFFITFACNVSTKQEKQTTKSNSTSITKTKANEEINAADYGLVAGTDGTLAIIKALEDAKLKSAKRLIIPKGKYFFSTQKALEKYIAISNNDNGMKRMVFAIIGFNNFEIDAQGSEFVFDGSMIPFVLENSNNITLKGFSVDWEKPMYGQAEVVAVNKAQSYFDVKIDKEFSYEVHKGTLWFKTYSGKHDTGKNLFFYPNKGGTVYDVDGYKLDTWNEWHADSYTAKELEPGKVRIKVLANNKLPEVGWNWVSKGSDKNDRLSPAFRLYRSFDVNVTDVTIYHAGAMGLIAEKSGNITIDNMKVIAPPNTTRAVSTTADATHFVNCKGTITVKNSYFAHMLDDAINVHGIYTRIVEIKDDYTLGIQQKHEEQVGFDFAEPGDTLVVADIKTLMPVDTLVVKSYKWFNEEYQEVTFDKPLNKNVEINFGIENLSWCAGLNFINNTVEKNRARGILFSTRGKVLVEGNTFSNMMAGISISGDNNYWFESGPSDSIFIRNNKFLNCCTGSKGNTVIMIAPIITHPELSKGHYIKYVSISNNFFEAFDKGLVYALSVEKLEFTGNIIVHNASLKPLFPEKPTFEINKCQQVLLEKNVFNDFQDGTILIDFNSEKELVISKNEKMNEKITITKSAEGLNTIL